MMIAFRYIIIPLFVLGGCAQHVSISPRKCMAPKAVWSSHKDEDSFSYVHHIRKEKENTYLRRIFDRKNIKCSELDHVNLVHKYTWKDIIWNMIPFSGRSTLVVSGNHSKIFVDDD